MSIGQTKAMDTPAGTTKSPKFCLGAFCTVIAPFQFSTSFFFFFFFSEKQFENEEKGIWEHFPDFFVETEAALVELGGMGGSDSSVLSDLQVLLLLRQRKVMFMMRDLC